MSFLKYLWKSGSTRGQILFSGFFGIAFLTSVFYSLSQTMNFGDMWQRWMEPFLAFATIFIAGFIWYNEKKQDWENNLPKKLKVFFFLGEKVFYQVENAPLAGDNDIRQWGQQIGRQMNGDKNLLFNGFNVKGPVRDKDSKGEDVMLYELIVWLQSIDEDKTEKIWIYGENGKLVEQKPLEISVMPSTSEDTETEQTQSAKNEILKK